LIHPGASALWRRWPPARFAALAARLAREGRARPVLLEGPAEPGLAAEIARLAGLPLPILRPADVESLGAIMAQCRLFIGHSSGPFHVACLVGTRTVTLWGDTDPALWGPAWEAERHAVLRSPRPCAPCERWSVRGHRIARDRAPDAGGPCAECLAAIGEPDVWLAALRKLEESGHQGP
jgi:ADP-heptose:LPS heptosyltransferase